MLKSLLKSNSGFILPSVLLITLLITTMLFSILTIVYFYNSYTLNIINKKKMELACFSALQSYISENQRVKENEKTVLIDSIRVRLRVRSKGIFTEIETTALGKKDSTKVIYLLGNTITAPFDNAIIVSKKNLRAAITGKTNIVGDMFLTSDRVKIGRISGISSTDKNYLDGKIKINEDIETKYFNDNLILNLFDKNKFSDDIRYIDGDFELISSAFINRLNYKLLYIKGNLIIKGYLNKLSKFNNIVIFVTGKTIFEKKSISNLDMQIICDSTVLINEDTKLENVIITSESEIKIQKNTHFKNVQFFSKKGISIYNSVFEYPSILALYSDLDNKANLQNKIDINSSIINGTILLINSTVGLANNKNLIVINGSSKVHGLIYSENNVDISGQVNGIVYTHSFWYYKKPTEYINWLVDVKVDRKKLDKAFLLPLGFGEINNLAILKETWIN